MGVFDFLKSSKETQATPPKKDRPECDITKTGVIDKLLTVPKNQRDDIWERNFIENIRTASFACTSPQVIQGPDGFYYFGLKIPEPSKPFESFCISNMVSDFLLEKGLGVSINPNNNSADWAFSYGDIVNLHLRKEFYTPVGNIEKSFVEVIKQKEEVLVAQPSEDYLPKETRTILKHYLPLIGIKDPKILLLARKKDKEVEYSLAFNLFTEDIPSEQVFRIRLQQIGWFLPKHYIITSVSKKSDLAKKLVEL